MTEQKDPGRPEDEPIVVRDKRRVNDESGAPRTPSERDISREGAEDRAEAGSAPEAGSAGTRETEVPTEGQLGEIDRLTSELAERTGDLQRVNAEYANYRKRSDRERQDIVPMAQAALIAQLLPVLDDIDRADQHGDLTGGFKNVADALRKVLTDAGIEPFGEEGEPFDPQIHQAVAKQPSAEVDSEQVAAVMRKGYRQGERVLREAMVAVAAPE